MNPVVLSGPNSRAVTFPVASLFRYRLPPSVYQNAADAGRQRDSQHQSSNAGTRVGASRAVWNKRRRAGMVCQSAVLSHPMRATRPVPPRLMYPMTYSLRVHLYLVFFNSAFLGLHSRTTCTKRYPEVGGFSSSIWIMPVTAVVQKCGVGMHSVAARGRRYFVNGCNIREKGFASGFRCLSAGFRTPVGQQTINRGSVALHG